MRLAKSQITSTKFQTNSNDLNKNVQNKGMEKEGRNSG
jgi:hypothetical protein